MRSNSRDQCNARATMISGTCLYPLLVDINIERVAKSTNAVQNGTGSKAAKIQYDPHIIIDACLNFGECIVTEKNKIDIHINAKAITFSLTPCGALIRAWVE